jgi:hypothetical protein
MTFLIKVQGPYNYQYAVQVHFNIMTFFIVFYKESKQKINYLHVKIII